jgi:enhancer of polycomb-like protein
VQNVDYAKLYQVHKVKEHTNFIRFSDTVEESSGGWGGLGYCMDDEDERWLSAFNGKMEGSSGTAGAGANGAAEGKENMPLGATPSKGKKGKDKAEEKPAPMNISEDTFEFVMGVLEKHAEDALPTLHTVSLIPTVEAVPHTGT